MPRRHRKTADIQTAMRDKRIVEARVAGRSAMEIAATEHIDISTVYRALKDACTNAISAETKEMLLVRNLERLEQIIQANHASVQGGDPTATGNLIKAIQEQNKMLGVQGGGGVSISLGSGGNEAAQGVGLNISFVPSSHKDEPDDPPAGYKPYSAMVLPLKLVEQASDPEPQDKPETVAVPEGMTGRPGFPAGVTQAPSNPMRPAAGSVNDQSFVAQNPSSLRTEFDQPLTERFGFNTDDRRTVFPEPRKPKKDW